MQILNEGKQVGDLSYMVESIPILENIIEYGNIFASSKAERNPVDGKKMHYVSFSRNLVSASARNVSKWKYGVIIDGDKLSDKYKITPYSFGGTQTPSTGRFRVRYMVLYDDNTAILNLANWSRTFFISADMFKYIENLILNMPEEDKRKFKLSIETGKRRQSGKLAIKRYRFNIKNGGLKLNLNSMGSRFTDLIKNTSLNETEERIWLFNASSIDISGCIKGIILPKSELKDIQVDNSDLIDTVKSVAGKNFKLVTY